MRQRWSEVQVQDTCFRMYRCSSLAKYLKKAREKQSKNAMADKSESVDMLLDFVSTSTHVRAINALRESTLFVICIITYIAENLAASLRDAWHSSEHMRTRIACNSLLRHPNLQFLIFKRIHTKQMLWKQRLKMFMFGFIGRSCVFQAQTAWHILCFIHCEQFLKENRNERHAKSHTLERKVKQGLEHVYWLNMRACHE